jgi:hypothetical protein
MPRAFKSFITRSQNLAPSAPGEDQLDLFFG